jgi:hypothetical protein
MKHNILEVIDILIDHVPSSRASELVQICHDSQMTPKIYRPSPHDANLPEFDTGYQFLFASDGCRLANLDILQTDERILQAGIQLFIPRRLFLSRSTKYRHTIVKHLDKHYGLGAPLQAGQVDLMNYGDSSSVCYISKTVAQNEDIITVRVGNRMYWP